MLWLRLPKRPSGREKANASAAGKHTFRSHNYDVFSYSKLKSRLKRMHLAKKKKTHFENFGNFRWIGPIKSFNLRRFFRWALGSRGGGGAHDPNAPPFGYAPAISVWGRSALLHATCLATIIIGITLTKTPQQLALLCSALLYVCLSGHCTLPVNRKKIQKR